MSVSLGAICFAAFALGSSNAYALPKDDGGGGGDGGGDGGGGDPSPRPRPPKQPQKPQIAGYVLCNGAYYRESTLPLCEWGPSDRSLHEFLRGHDQDNPAVWTCQAGGGGDDSCSFEGEPGAYRPSNATYWLAPRDQGSHYSDNFVWPDGSAAYGGWGLGCARNTSSSVIDTVTRANFEGIAWNGDNCQPVGKVASATVVAELVGGDVEHIRPAIVRVQANIGYYQFSGPARPQNDMVLAIQVYGDSGWQDYATATRTTGKQPAWHEFEAAVPAGSFVRLQVRGMQNCVNHYGDSYDLRALRIQVETCIPDQNNPGNCL